MLEQWKLFVGKWNSDNLNCRSFKFMTSLNYKKILNVVICLLCLFYIIKYYYLSYELHNGSILHYCIHLHSWLHIRKNKEMVVWIGNNNDKTRRRQKWKEWYQSLREDFGPQGGWTVVSYFAWGMSGEEPYMEYLYNNGIEAFWHRLNREAKLGLTSRPCVCHCT